METNQNNLFYNFQQKKKQVCKLAEAALKAGWLDEKAYKEILSKIEEDVLTIGVIGQMKCGKSTFLNSFLFGRPLLPAATTPMTAALSVITYGTQKGIEAEFYSVDEWEEQKALAARNENEIGDPQTKSKIKAAKELCEKSSAIRGQLPSLLGTTKHDDFDNLIEYVGADGKYVSIVKSVKITLPEEWLKGVEIVDTPGFNDPIVSREERTQDFLKRADVVLMMLYAGRAFDATDNEILFEKVRKVGVGKIILAVNKYDIQLAQGESPEEIKSFVMDELKKAIRKHQDESVSELLEEIAPVLVSAQMALLAKMPMSEINRNPDLTHHYNKACDDFELSSQAELLAMSKINDLEEKVRDIISNQKEQILIRKPINLIFQKAKNTLGEIDEQLTKLKEQKTNLEMPDDELETKIANLDKAQRRIGRKIENAEIDLGDAYDEISTKIFREIQNTADEAKDECTRIIDQYKKEELNRNLNSRLERFREREYPRLIDDANKKIKRAFSTNLIQLTEDVENIIEKYLDNYEELTEQFKRTLEKGLDNDLGNRMNEGEGSTTEDEDSWFSIAMGLVALPIVLPIMGIASMFETGRDEARAKRDEFFSAINWDDLQSKLKAGKSRFIKTLNGDAAKDLIDGLRTQAEDARGDKEKKENELIEVTNKISELVSKQNQLNEELDNLKKIVSIV